MDASPAPPEVRVCFQYCMSSASVEAHFCCVSCSVDTYFFLRSCFFLQSTYIFHDSFHDFVVICMTHPYYIIPNELSRDASSL